MGFYLVRRLSFVPLIAQLLEKFDLEKCGQPIFPDGESYMTGLVLDGRMVYPLQLLVYFDVPQ